MKVLHFISRIDQEASGLAHSIPNLCKNLALVGNQVELKCLAARGAIENIKLSTYPSSGRLSSARALASLIRAVRREASHVDIVHSHSLWSIPSFAAGWLVPGKRAKLVVSPRGTLAPWALNWRRHRKRLLWPIQERLLTQADLLHATSEVEYKQFRDLGLSAPVAIVPNGVDIPVDSAPKNEQRTPSAKRTLLFLGRIHPIKGIDDLLMAWERLESSHPNWQLVIAGKGEAAHEEHVRELAKTLQLKNVEFPGPLYGDEKSDAYYNADLFVLPTHTENFGIVVAEALAHGCPAIVTHGAPWEGLKTEKCGWWIERDLDVLTETLDRALQLTPDKLAQMGSRGRRWMTRDFSWHAVAEQMNDAYRWISLGVAKPKFIRLE